MYVDSILYQHLQVAKNYSLDFFTVGMDVIFVEELCCSNNLLKFSLHKCHMCRKTWLTGILINLAFGSLTYPTGAIENGKNSINYMNNFIEAMLFWEKSEGEKKVRKQ